MKWLNYIFGNLKKVTDIKIDYILITKSGNEIITIREIIKPNKLLIRNYNDYEWNLWEKDILDIYRTEIEKRAEELLNKFQKKQRNKLGYCILDSGDYIIKCSWEIWKELDYITYKEYLKYIEEDKIKVGV